MRADAVYNTEQRKSLPTGSLEIPENVGQEWGRNGFYEKRATD